MKALNFREQALSWWNDLGADAKSIYFKRYINTIFTPAKDYTEVTGREIQMIWGIEVEIVNDLTIEILDDYKPIEQPYYKGRGNHSVNELEAICEQYKEYVHQLKIN